jgi:hypothetical protein
MQKRDLPQMTHDALRLHADDGDARTALQRAVDALLAAGRPSPRLEVVLDGEHLAEPIIHALVTNLRRLRERGGAIRAIPATAAIRDALAVTGLDRVFAFPLVPDEQPRRRRGLRRLVRALSSS